MDRPGGPDSASILTRTLLDVEGYRDELLTQLDVIRRSRSVVPSERIPVQDSVGRTLATDAVAAVDVPAFDNSGMDGYAVRWADLAQLPARLRVVADVPAGSGVDPTLGPGECARIMTGAPVPSEADTVVQVELTDDGREVVTVTSLPEPGEGAFIRRRGSSVSVGTLVASAGTRIDPGVLAALISGGAGEVTVAPLPRIAVASTGDELVRPGKTLGRGQIHDVNSHYLAAQVAALGGAATLLPPLPDDEATFTDRLGAACATHDLVVVTGGASVGDHDVARMVLGSREHSAFRHVRMQPGKPQGWARWGDALVVALPGNPLSAAVSFQLFVVPLIEALLGADRGGSAMLRARAIHAWRSPAGRRQFVPARLSCSDDGVVEVTSTHRHGSASHLTTSLAGAEVLAVVPEDVVEVSPGQVLDIVRMR